MLDELPLRALSRRRRVARADTQEREANRTGAVFRAGPVERLKKPHQWLRGSSVPFSSAFKFVRVFGTESFGQCISSQGCRAA